MKAGKQLWNGKFKTAFLCCEADFRDLCPAQKAFQNYVN